MPIALEITLIALLAAIGLGAVPLVLRNRVKSFIASASRNFGGLSGGISMVLALFDHWQSTRTPRQEKPS